MLNPAGSSQHDQAFTVRVESAGRIYLRQSNEILERLASLLWTELAQYSIGLVKENDSTGRRRRGIQERDFK
jgi:hypothetical protein